MRRKGGANKQTYEDTQTDIEQHTDSDRYLTHKIRKMFNTHRHREAHRLRKISNTQEAHRLRMISNTETSHRLRKISNQEKHIHRTCRQGTLGDPLDRFLESLHKRRMHH